MHACQALLYGLSVLLIVARVVANNSSEIPKTTDCQRRPRKLIKAAKTCCEVPPPDFQPYQSQCENFEASNASIRCQLDCLFNASQALTAHHLNLAKLHVLLDQVFPGAAEFVAAYYVSFVECIPLVEAQLKHMENNTNRSKQCAPEALLYAACAQMKLLKHCPTVAWHEEEGCQDARNYVLQCATSLLPKNRRNRRKFEENSSLVVEQSNVGSTTATKS